MASAVSESDVSVSSSKIDVTDVPFEIVNCEPTSTEPSTFKLSFTTTAVESTDEMVLVINVWAVRAPVIEL